MNETDDLRGALAAKQSHESLPPFGNEIVPPSIIKNKLHPMKHFIIKWLISTAALLIIIHLFSGVQSESLLITIITALVSSRTTMSFPQVEMNGTTTSSRNSSFHDLKSAVRARFTLRPRIA